MLPTGCLIAVKSFPCRIYKTAARDGAYLYLPEATHSLEELPEPLQKLFAQREQVLQIDLDQNTRLAVEEVSEVLRNLQLQGFHLQLKRDDWL